MTLFHTITNTLVLLAASEEDDKISGTSLVENTTSSDNDISLENMFDLDSVCHVIKHSLVHVFSRVEN